MTGYPSPGCLLILQQAGAPSNWCTIPLVAHCLLLLCAEYARQESLMHHVSDAEHVALQPAPPT
jgi:hypothetical protein